MKENRKIKIGDKEFEYKLKKRRGTRAVKLSVYDDGYVSVLAPKWYPIRLIEKFIKEKSQWIFETIQGKESFLRDQNQDYKANKEKARQIIKIRIEQINKSYNFFYNRVAIRNQRSCWGSCSQKKNLNFNYKIIKLPVDLQDYVIVHELCHLKELNHSQRFWELVGKTIPDFKAKRKKLREIKI